MPYNPMPGYSYMDPEAIPKPSWSDVVRRFKMFSFDGPLSIIKPGEFSNSEIEEHRKSVAAAGHAIDDSDVHVGGGLAHMPSLIHMLSHGENAGIIMPAIVMRESAGHDPKVLHTKKSAAEFVTGIARRRNLAESAHNRIIKPYYEQLAIFNDTSLSSEVRYDAGVRLDEFATAYPAKLKAEMQAIASEEFLPSDVPTLRTKYMEILEAIATEHVAHIKHAVTQQGVDLLPSCIEQDTALKEVAEAKQIGQIELERATNIANLKREFNRAAIAIKNISVLRTPEWQYSTGQPVGAGTLSVGASRLVFRAAQPDGDPPIRGRISVLPEILPPVGSTEAVSGAGFTAEYPADQTYAVVTITATKTTLFRLRARNICGPAVLEVTLRP